MNQAPTTESNTYNIYKVGLINQAPTTESNTYNIYKVGLINQAPTKNQTLTTALWTLSQQKK